MADVTKTLAVLLVSSIMSYPASGAAKRPLTASSSSSDAGTPSRPPRRWSLSLPPPGALALPAPPRPFCGVMVRDDRGRILLGRRLRGRFGRGLWQHAFAGKPEVPTDGGDPRRTAARELEEESGLRVDPGRLRPVAKLFYDFESASLFPAPMEVLVFTAAPGDLSGSPRRTEEAEPVWFDPAEVPYSNMWADNSLWLPRVLRSPAWPPEEALLGYFLYSSLDRVSSHHMEFLPVSDHK